MDIQDIDTSSQIQLHHIRRGDYVDVLYALLVSLDETQFIPELYEIFGREHLVKFLDIFAGQTVKVPPREVIEKCIKEVFIWYKVQAGVMSLARVAKEFGVSIPYVQNVCERVHKALLQVGIKPEEVEPYDQS